MATVKGFVALAIVMLIPSMAYFQKQRFESDLQPRLKAAAMEVLVEEGVESPAVEMVYLDAVISGRVGSDERREAVAARVQALPGLRVPREANKLQTYGWIRLSRTDGVVRGEGVMPEDFAISLPAGLGSQSGWDAGVERRSTVETPEGARNWSSFLKYYFAEPGNRSVELRADRLTMRGDATAGLRGDWLSKASEVVAKDQVVDEFTLHPSVYHFPGFQPVSLTDAPGLEQLRTELGAKLVSFGAGTSLELGEEELQKVVEAAGAIQKAGEGGRYVVGGHPAEAGNVTENGQLARQRAQAVVDLLVEHGVTAEQLEVAVFGVTPGGGRDNQVEIVVK